MRFPKSFYYLLTDFFNHHAVTDVILIFTVTILPTTTYDIRTEETEDKLIDMAREWMFVCMLLLAMGIMTEKWNGRPSTPSPRLGITGNNIRLKYTLSEPGDCWRPTVISHPVSTIGKLCLHCWCDATEYIKHVQFRNFQSPTVLSSRELCSHHRRRPN